MYLPSFSTTPIGPDPVGCELRCRRVFCSLIESSLRARDSPASIMAATRALDREGERSCAREMIGILNVAAWAAAMRAMHSSSVESFILKGGAFLVFLRGKARGSSQETCPNHTLRHSVEHFEQKPQTNKAGNMKVKNTVFKVLVMHISSSNPQSGTLAEYK